MARHSWTDLKLQRAKTKADAADERARAANAELRDAIDARRQARANLAAAVLEARAAGRTHIEIGAILGITPQGAKAIADRARRD